MQAIKSHESSGELITQTEAARMIGKAPFTPLWYDIISQPKFPRMHYPSPLAKRGAYKRSEIQNWIDNFQ